MALKRTKYQVKQEPHKDLLILKQVQKRAQRQLFKFRRDIVTMQQQKQENILSMENNILQDMNVNFH